MSSSPLAASSGIVSGINWNNIIQAMLSAQEQPIIALQGQQSSVTQEQQVYTSLLANLNSLQTSAESLRLIGGNGLDTSSASSTNASVASATAQSGALAASVSVQVNALATSAQAQSSADIYTGPNSTASAPSDTSSANITTSSSFSASASLSSQSSYLATAPASGGTFTVNGASITWTSSQSLNDILGMINSSTAGVTASYNATTGEVTLAGDSTGASSTLTLGQSSGNLLSVLNLSAGSASGTNAVTFDPTATLASQASSMDTAVTAGTFSINGVVFEVNPATQSLNDVIQAINASSAGVQAVFNAQTGELNLSTKSQGSSAQITLGASGDTSNFLAAFKMGTVSPGQDAQVSVNGGTVQNLTSNTSSTLLAGATVTLNGLGSATLNVGPSAADAASAVQSFVNAYNSALSSVESYLNQSPPTPATIDPTAPATTQAANSNPSIQGAFIGDPLLQRTADMLINQVINTQASGGSITQLSQIGVSLTLNGGGDQPPTLSFNQSAFEAAYTANPSAVNALISAPGTGLADTLYTSLQGLTDPTQGAYQIQINGENSTLSSLSQQITDMQANLTYQQKSLQTQYALLEASLATMKSQGSAISGTLTSLASVA